MKVHHGAEDVFIGLRFPEGMRWHEDRLWFSDMHDGTVHSGEQRSRSAAVVIDLGDQAGGLEWLPDGVMLVSSMSARKVLRVDSRGSATVFADLADSTDYLINDMFREPVTGCLYVGDFGYRLYEGEPFQQGHLWRVDPDGGVHLAADQLDFPNTTVMLPQSRTIVLPETFGARLTAFDVSPDGELTGRRQWAPLPEGTTPDGCCVDPQGGLWVATLNRSEFIRVLPGGAITDRVPVPGRLAIDCVLGGPSGRTLFMATADDVMPSVTATTRQGRIEPVDL